METIKIIESTNKTIDKAVNFLYVATVIASISINVFDIFRLIDLSESYILYTNIPSIFIILVAFLLKITNIISLKKSFSIVILAILLNGIVSIFQSRFLEDLIVTLFRESIFMAFLISLSAFVVSRYLATFVSTVFSIFIIILYLVTKDKYLLENLPVLILIFIAYTIFINYLVEVLWNTMYELKEKNSIINKQLDEIKIQNTEFKQINDELNKNRNILEDKNDQLNRKNIELTVSQQELEKINDTKNKLFSVIGHDIKNPMHVVLGYSKLLKERYEKLADEKKIHYINTIDNNINNLYILLDNLLLWSKTQQNSIEFNPDNIDVNRLISDCINFYKDQLKNKGLKIDFATEPDLFAYADRNMIYFVIKNLISNAIKYSNSKNEIRIIGEKDTINIRVHVIDNGKGISEELNDKIFELHERTSELGTKGEKGTGFGLAISKEHIEKNKGEIWYSSIIDKETRFSIQLPRNK